MAAATSSPGKAHFPCTALESTQAQNSFSWDRTSCITSVTVAMARDASRISGRPAQTWAGVSCVAAARPADTTLAKRPTDRSCMNSVVAASKRSTAFFDMFVRYQELMSCATRMAYSDVVVKCSSTSMKALAVVIVISSAGWAAAADLKCSAERTTANSKSFSDPGRSFDQPAKSCAKASSTEAGTALAPPSLPTMLANCSVLRRMLGLNFAAGPAN
mmetsp:Transcript_100811/g.262808  ORF Transcript_100811/g.262808 Transcript_100811/m.262808 type:complete len:217 (+) Transcript_100811:1005-1655(+)